MCPGNVHLEEHVLVGWSTTDGWPVGLQMTCTSQHQITATTLTLHNIYWPTQPPRPTQPSIPPGSVNEYQLQLGRQRQIWLNPIADEHVDVQVKWKKNAQRDANTGCSKAEPKFFALPQTPFLGTQDGQNLISWRWSLPSPTDSLVKIDACNFELSW